DGAPALTFQILHGAKVVPSVGVLSLQVHNALEKCARDLMISDLQLGHSHLVQDLDFVGSSLQCICVIVQGIFWKAPCPEYIRSGLQLLRRCCRRIRQGSLDQRPLEIFMLQFHSYLMAMGVYLCGYYRAT